MISHHIGDKGGPYWRRLRHQTPKADKKQDAYPCGNFCGYTDFMTYPPLIERFGNALPETLYFRLASLVNRHLVGESNLTPSGFVPIETAATFPPHPLFQRAQALL